MSHYQQLKFVELASTHLPDRFRGRDVLEVGSWIANHTVRDYFTECRYVGADVAAGPGVDIVCPGEKLDFPDASFDVAISVECFEHNPAWEATFENMVRMLRPGGLCLITCASIGRREHGTSRRVKGSSLTAMSGHQDHYMNLSKSDLDRVARRLGAFAQYHMLYNAFRHDLYFIGIKQGGASPLGLPPALLDEAARITEEVPPSFLRALRKRVKFVLVFGFARLLGERAYHNLNHWVRSAGRSRAG